MSEPGISADFSMAADGDEIAVEVGVTINQILPAAKRCKGKLVHSSNGEAALTHDFDYRGLSSHHFTRDETLHHAEHGHTETTLTATLTLQDGSTHELGPITHGLDW